MQRKIALALAVGLLVQLIEGIQYQHDELLYTKAIWDELKLPFPFAAFAEDDLVISRARETIGDLFTESSLDGPFPNLRELIEEDKRRGRFQPSSFDVSPIEEVTPLLDVAPVVSCKACIALTDELWSALRNWTHASGRRVAARDLISLGEEMCEQEVPTRVLSEWILLSARVYRAPESPGAHPLLAGAGGSGPRRAQLQYYMLSLRHRQNARMREIQVVRAACRSLLSTVHADAYARGNEASLMGLVEFDAIPSALLEAAAAAQGDYLAAVLAAGAVAPVQEAESKPPPLAQRVCYDRHPQCVYWAQRGECKANPNYMVGSAITGWCRAACKACQRPPPVPLPAGVDPKDGAKALEEVSKILLGRLHAAGCTRAAACRWVEGSDAKEDLAAAAGVESGRNTALSQVSIVSGPVETRQGRRSGTSSSGITAPAQDGPPMVNPILLQVSRVSTQRPYAHAIVPKPDGGHSVAAGSPGRNAPAAERALWAELGGLCLYSTAGWWSYELCYREGAVQFHVPPGSQAPEWVIAIGHHTGADWTIRNATDAGLYPEGASVPYVTARLEGGSECELTGEGGVDSLNFIYGDGDDDPEIAEDLQEIIKVKGDREPHQVNFGREKMRKTASKAAGKVGDRIPRSAIVRYMCSPDSIAHLAVAEPAQCVYVVDVYLAELCFVPGMAPHVPEEVAARALAAWGEHAIKGEADVDVIAVDQVMDDEEDDDDDDPYVDPDELEDDESEEEEAEEYGKSGGGLHDEL